MYREILPVPCPSCRKDLYLPISELYEGVQCPRCSSRYEYATAQLESQSVVESGDSSNQLWKYNLRVNYLPKTGTQINAVSFQFHHQHLALHRKDQILIIKNDWGVAQIQNLTDPWTAQIQASNYMEWVNGLILTAIAGVMGYVLFIIPGLIFIPIAALMLSYRQFGKKLSKAQSGDEIQDAKQKQACLEVLYSDNERLRRVSDDFTKNRTIVGRLQALLQDQHVPNDRFDLLNRAIQQLNEHQNELQDLINRYKAKISKMWVDMEVNSLAGSMPDSISSYRLESSELEELYQNKVRTLSVISDFGLGMNNIHR